MKHISTIDLRSNGYREDAAESIRSEHPFLGLGILIGIVMGVLIVAEILGKAKIVQYSLAAVVMLIFISVGIRYYSRPTDPHTGKKLERYKNASAKPGFMEIVYVNHGNKTFYRRVISTPDVGTGPS